MTKWISESGSLSFIIFKSGEVSSTSPAELNLIRSFFDVIIVRKYEFNEVVSIMVSVLISWFAFW